MPTIPPPSRSFGVFATVETRSQSCPGDKMSGGRKGALACQRREGSRCPWSRSNPQAYFSGIV
jgi:hypothetical protein